MYPLQSYLILRALDEERLEQANVSQRIALSRQHRPMVRSLALTLGHAFKAAGTRLEQYGQ